MGDDLLAKYKNRNVQKVADLAANKGRGEDGSIPPRVGGAVFDAASFAEDELVAEYLSGVLASSRSPDGKDDTGVSWAALVARLSSDQLKLHYLLYSSAAFHLRNVDLTSLDVLTGAQLYMPLEPVIEMLTEAGRFNEAVMNLVREGLVGGSYEVQVDAEELSPDRAIPEGPGMLYYPTPSGAALYLWGVGLGRTSVRQFNHVEVTLPEGVELPVPVPLSGRYDEFPARPQEISQET
jgi:hypothetical protein